MAQMVAIFLLLVVTAGLWHGSRGLLRSPSGQTRLGAFLDRYPRAVAAALLLAVASLVVLGVWALLHALP